MTMIEVANLIETMRRTAGAQNLFLKVASEDGGLRMWTRKNIHQRWYSHGLFGSDCSLEVAKAEVIESIRLCWEEKIK